MFTVFKKYFSLLSPVLYQRLKTSDNSGIFLRLFKGSFWNTIQISFNRGISFIGTVIIIRILGREQFGEFGMINATITTFSMFAVNGISQTLTKYVADFKDADKAKTGKMIGISVIFSMVTGLIITAIILVFGNYIATKSLSAPELGTLLKIAAIGIIFSTTNAIQNGILTGCEAFKNTTLVGIITGTLTTLVKVGLTFTWGLTGAIIGMTVEPLISLIIIQRLTFRTLFRNSINIIFKDAFKEFPLLMKFSLPSILIFLVIMPVTWYSLTMLTQLHDGYFQIGAFNAANQWFNLFLFIPYIICAGFLPVLSNTMSSGNHEIVFKIINNTLLLLLVITLAITLLFWIFGKYIVLIYGKEFIGTQKILLITVATIIPQSLSIAIGNITLIINKVWVSLLITIIWAASFLFLLKFMVASGAFGYATARFLASSVNFLSFLIYFLLIKRKYNPLKDLRAG